MDGRVGHNAVSIAALNERLKELGAKITHRQVYEVIRITCQHENRDKVEQTLRQSGYRRENGWMMGDGTYCISAKRDIKAAEMATGAGVDTPETDSAGRTGGGEASEGRDPTGR